MSHHILPECVCCAECLPVCPEGCIEQGDESFTIDARRCTDCGACVPACPVAVIVHPPPQVARGS